MRTLVVLERTWRAMTEQSGKGLITADQARTLAD